MEKCLLRYKRKFNASSLQTRTSIRYNDTQLYNTRKCNAPFVQTRFQNNQKIIVV
jgi:hypothetical protein